MSKRTRVVVLVGLLVTLVLAGGVSYYASSSPDGLNKVATDKGINDGEKDHALSDWPLAGYALKGVDNERLSGGLAGVAGVAMAFLIGGGLMLAVRRRDAAPASTAESEQSSDAGGART